jgi:co-chaperonin GroES (HSP10)
MNLAGLTSYKNPLNTPQFVEQNGSGYIAPAKVYWNQMSDRPRPSNQVTKVASGSSYHTSSTRHTITRDRPGAMSPGGVGVDIKHNSYDRYLNKLKGKSVLRRGIIPPNYGSPIPFNNAFPVYGGKTVKTSIVNGCHCPDTNTNDEQDKLIYGSSSSAIQDKILSVKYTFNVGDFVWAKKYESDTILYKGQIKSILNDLYTVEFDDTTATLTYCELLIYFDCDQCKIDLSLKDQLFVDSPNQKQIQFNEVNKSILCSIVNII